MVWFQPTQPVKLHKISPVKLDLHGLAGLGLSVCLQPVRQAEPIPSLG